MSMDLMVKAMKAKVGHPLRKLVLLKLADNASDLGECWPSYQHIADQCELSRSTVKVHIRELEKAGFLRREFRRKGELNQSNVFHLSFEGGAAENLGGGAVENPPGAESARGGGAESAPRTSHSSEPVKEPKPTGKPDPMEGFDQFWKLYPKKKGRKDAVKAWTRMAPDEALRATLISSLGRQCLSLDWTKDGGRYVPNPATWLNGERWEDVLQSGGDPQAAQSAHMNLDQIDHTEGLVRQPDGSYRIARPRP